MIRRFHPWPMAILIALSLWLGVIMFVLWLAEVIE